MPVRVGTGSSAVDLSALRVAGVAPSKIMLGTGTSAVEAWSARPTGSWSGGELILSQNLETTLLSHTVSAPGRASITGSVMWYYSASNTTLASRLLINGAERAIDTSRPFNVSNHQHNLSVPELTLNAGDVVSLTARGSASTENYRRVMYSSLTLA